jgi:hypothetical protein
MPLEDLTGRERLALDLEHTTEGLWSLVDRDAPTAGKDDAPTAGKDDAPTVAELRDLVAVLRRLDAIGVGLAPSLYRPSERRRGELDL